MVPVPLDVRAISLMSDRFAMSMTLLRTQLRARKEWKFFQILPRADGPLAMAWWAVLVLRGVLPALFAIAIGGLVGAVERGDDLALPLSFVSAVFVTLQV